MICGKLYLHSRELRKHYKTHHEEEELIAKGIDVESLFNFREPAKKGLVAIYKPSVPKKVNPLVEQE